MTDPQTAAGRAPVTVKLGLMLTALTVLVCQVALTRVMSVAVNYHSAFLILAVVMLGMAGSAVSAYLGLRRAARPVTPAETSTAAYKAAVATFVGLVGFVFVAARNWGPASQPVLFILAPALFFGGFYFSGYVVALVLTYYARDMARLYWFDLVGAAGGSLLVVPLLNGLSALAVIVLCAAGLAAAGTLFALAHGGPAARRAGPVLTAALVVAGGVSAARPDLLRLQFAKGEDQSLVVWERWNAQARVSVSPQVPGTREATALYERTHGTRMSADQVEALNRRLQAGWGLSRAYRGPLPASLWVQLDSDAGTPILQDGVAALGDRERLAFLAWDVTAAAYAWRSATGRPPEDVFVIGGGGGRDVLAALSFDAGRVDVVELNPDVVRAVQDRFGDFSGRVYSHPRVRLTVGEARGELTRRPDRYDVIQMSMIDTWASSMAGSMVMSENNLYTREAFDLYASRLKPDGVLTVTRWYHPVRYGESARILVLMADALRRAGAARPEDHIAFLTAHGELDTAQATALLKRSPFTDPERAALRDLCRERGYRLLWPPADGTGEAPFDVAGVVRLDPAAVADPRFDLTPPTDDRPFFFNIDRPVGSWAEAVRTGDYARGSRASLVLGSALVVMCLACLWFVVRPLRAARDGAEPAPPAREFLPPVFYFGGIGLGFMLVELALIQRYILLLGHPSYAISVVLFALLLFGGLGSYLTDRIEGRRLAGTARLALAATAAGIVTAAVLVPDWVARVADWAWPARVAIAVGLIGPLAVFMGMIFPLGARRLAATGRERLVPWMWGVNGICGVVALVLGMLLAMYASYTAVLLAGAAAYGVTFLALALDRTPAGADRAPEAAPAYAGVAD
jgi:Spermine/spermidine synthase domain